MYVCNCMGITDRKIRCAVSDGASTVKQLRDQIGVASCCGKCAGDARELIFDTLLGGSATLANQASANAAVPVGRATVAA